MVTESRRDGSIFHGPHGAKLKPDVNDAYAPVLALAPAKAGSRTDTVLY